MSHIELAIARIHSPIVNSGVMNPIAIIISSVSSL